MAKPFEETTVGQIINRLGDTGSIGTMEHSFDTKTIVKMAGGLLAIGIVFLLIKKYLIKA